MSFHKDPTFSAQIARTLGYASYLGAEVGECIALGKRILEGDDESWFQAWIALGDQAFFLGKEAEGKDPDSAYAAFLRASNYFRTAFSLLPDKDPRIIKAWEKSARAFQKALSQTEYDFENLDIPFEDTTLPALFFRGKGGAPLLIATCGMDATLEELFFKGAIPAIERGYHALIFEGPGQGGLFLKTRFSFRSDWERVIASVIDEALLQFDVDLEKIALYGASFGGFLAARAVAFEKRVSACILDPGIYDVFYPFFSRLPKKVQEHMREGKWEEAEKEMPENIRAFLERRKSRFGARDLASLIALAASYTLEEQVENISCPVLVLDNETEPFTPGEAKKLYENLDCTKQYVLFTEEEGGEGHCQPLIQRRVHEKIFSWLETILEKSHE